METLNNRLDQAEERLSEVEDRPLEISQTKEMKKKNTEKLKTLLRFMEYYQKA